jgi:putative transposase
VSDHQADDPIATMCRVLGVSSSGYHAWVKRRPSRRAETDAVLIAAIRAAHTASRGTYGAPRVHAELAAKGIRVGCKRVARLMTQAGLAGVCRRRFVVTTSCKKLQVARQALQLEAAIAKVDKYQLLILDDLSYVHKDHAETSVLFELIGARYERRPMLITANQPFADCERGLSRLDAFMMPLW